MEQTSNIILERLRKCIYHCCNFTCMPNPRYVQSQICQMPDMLNTRYVKYQICFIPEDPKKYGILSEQKCPFWRVFESLKLSDRSLLIGQKLVDK